MKRIWLHKLWIGVCLLFAGTTDAQVSMPDTVCVGTQRIYRVNDASVPSSYTWTINGQTQASQTHELAVTWNQPGVYTLTVIEHASNGCDGEPRSGTVYVMAPPQANAGPDVAICYETTVRLQASGGQIYQWSPPQYFNDVSIPNPRVTLPTTGTYALYLSVRSIGCPQADLDTIVVTMMPPVQVFTGNDTSIALNQTLQLNARDIANSGFTSYTWSPPSGLNNPFVANPQVSLNGLGNRTYTVTATNAQGCIDTDDITIKVFASADIYVPTAFTPNRDGLNDFAKAIPVGMREFHYFRIYNRWGELVFATSDPSKGWDGVFRGKPQDSNVFVWEAKAIDINGQVVFRKGTVTLIR